MHCNGYMDLNLILTASDINETLRIWYKNKYRTVALNQILDFSEFVAPKKKKKGEQTTQLNIPDPVKVLIPEDLKGKMTVLNRLTVKVQNVLHFPKVFQGKNLMKVKKFDIIAVMAEDQACLQLAIDNKDIDLICMDCRNKPTWKLNRKLYKVLLQKNKYLELSYGPTIEDSTVLKNTIFMSHLFYTLGKSKNVVISSETDKEILLRSPYEVIYLSAIFGLGEHQSRSTITSNSLNLIKYAHKRRQGKSFISVTTSEKSEL